LVKDQNGSSYHLNTNYYSVHHLISFLLMKNNYTLFLLVFCWFVFAPLSQAQSPALGFYVNMATPTGDLADHIDKPVGISLDVMFPLKKIPGLFVGGEFGVAMYANDDYLVANGEDDQFFEVNEEDCYIAYHAVAKYFVTKTGFLNPYLEAKLGGMSYFSTILSEAEEFNNKTSFHGSALNVGIGGGLVVNLMRNISLNSSVIYSVGSKANYRAINKEDRFTKGLDEGLKNAETNYINYKLGILIGF